MTSGDIMAEAWGDYWKYKANQQLIIGAYYCCDICERVYKRGKSKHPWASCGHPASRQTRISKQQYDDLVPVVSKS